MCCTAAKDMCIEVCVFVTVCSRPLLELCLPSSLDPTLAPPGCHVASIFSQYTPYHLEGGWTEEARERYAQVGELVKCVCVCVCVCV